MAYVLATISQHECYTYYYTFYFKTTLGSIIFKLSLNVREWITKELHFLPKQFNLPSIVLYKELSHDVILEALFFL